MTCGRMHPKQWGCRTRPGALGSFNSIMSLFLMYLKSPPIQKSIVSNLWYLPWQIADFGFLE
jgi:hypothetical protein